MVNGEQVSVSKKVKVSRWVGQERRGPKRNMAAFNLSWDTGTQLFNPPMICCCMIILEIDAKVVRALPLHLKI